SHSGTERATRQSFPVASYPSWASGFPCARSRSTGLVAFCRHSAPEWGGTSLASTTTAPRQRSAGPVRLVIHALLIRRCARSRDRAASCLSVELQPRTWEEQQLCPSRLFAPSFRMIHGT